MFRRNRALLLSAALNGVNFAASAADLPAASAPSHQLNFSATASMEVPRDLLKVSLQVMREGNDAGVVQSQLKQVLEGALAEARKSAETGQGMSVRTDTFSLSPRYGRDGKTDGWTGVATLTLEGRDTSRVAATAGRLPGMAISETSYSLSRELRERHESELTAQAIQKFQSRAAEMARQFGYSGYVLREANVETADSDLPRTPFMAGRSAAMLHTEAGPVPTEAGRGLLSATVHGSVALTR